MATENGLNGDTDLNKASTSKTCQEPEKDNNMNGENQNLETGKGDEKTNMVPFYKLFAFADRTDVLLMIVGTIGSIANGLSMPLSTILFGELTDSFGQNQNNNEVVDAVSEVALKLVYLAVGTAVAGFLRSHSELLKDPNGAYSQLIRLQEVRKELEQVPDDENGSDITEKSLGQTSLKMSLKKSISRGSSGEGNSSRHSFSASSGLPTGMNATNSVPADAAAASTIPSVQASDVSIRRLASFNKPEIPVLLLGSIASIINGLVLPTYALLLSEVIKTFYKAPNELKKDSRFWALIFMALGLASFLAISAERYLFSVAGCKLIQRIRSTCFEKVVRMEIGWFDEPEHSSGSLGARLSADAATLNSLVGDKLAQMVQSIVSLVAGLVIAFVASWQLALITIALLPLIGINGYVEVKFMKGFSADAKMMYEEASQVANDAVGGIRTIASFCAEEMVMRLYKKKCEHPVKAGIRQGLISGIGFGVSYFLLYSVIATDFYAGAQFVKHGHATFSDVFRVFFVLAMVAASIPQSSALGADSNKAKTAAASIFAIMDRMSKIDPNDESGVTLENVKGEIELSDVSFKYPLRPNIQIFQDLCLDIPAGKSLFT
ncbi:hypothetical protein CCACVL1_22032 [Corchorus capsularis]|uniref:ABC transmembrane type-1 domain-containing protein n=1 Tax=Corchorus capsularis TaxID=210143 RepID=A0A1R3H1A5_COCAP|nr:hypothetical protein CCACVL1_22032 [Corchorus capsularis]